MANRGYYVHNNDDDQLGIAVVAATAKEAKQIVYRSGEIIYGDTSWIALRSHWCRDADVEGLEVGIITDDRDALLRGLYGSLDGHPCDGCGRDYCTVWCYSEKALCHDCIEKEYAKAEINDTQLLELTQSANDVAIELVDENRLMLYVWEGVLCDYSCGVMFTLAHDVNEARCVMLEAFMGADVEDVERSIAESMQRINDVIKSPKSRKFRDRLVGYEEYLIGVPKCITSPEGFFSYGGS